MFMFGPGHDPKDVNGKEANGKDANNKGRFRSSNDREQAQADNEGAISVSAVKLEKP